MHAEAVREDATPSKEGLFRDESHPVKCLRVRCQLPPAL